MSNKIHLHFKKLVAESCIQVLTNRMELAGKAMNDAQEAANGEEKSSTGDKYETSRAMGHADRELYAKQMLEARNDLEHMRLLNLEKSDYIKAGSLFEVNEKLYFIGPGLGRINVEGSEVMVISKKAPIFSVFLNRKSGEELDWNGSKWEIGEVI